MPLTLLMALVNSGTSLPFSCPICQVNQDGSHFVKCAACDYSQDRWCIDCHKAGRALHHCGTVVMEMIFSEEQAAKITVKKNHLSHFAECHNCKESESVLPSGWREALMAIFLQDSGYTRASTPARTSGWHPGRSPVRNLPTSVKYAMSSFPPSSPETIHAAESLEDSSTPCFAAWPLSTEIPPSADEAAKAATNQTGSINCCTSYAPIAG
jgi:hypothetical protein